MTKQRKPPKQPKNRKLSNRSDNFTFSDHIRELRWRILWVALLFLVTSAVAYNSHGLLVQIVMAPLKGEKLIYLTPGGGFSFIFQITLYAGFIAAAPMLMYQLYGFVRPTLPEYAQKSAVRVAIFATLLMIVGVAYGYFVAVPAALTFLSTFAGTDIVPNLTADSYLSFFLSYIGGLAVLFQLPLLLIFWHWIKPMKPGGLLKSERYIILFAFVAAALITPTPDPANQAMIAVPLIAIYQIGVVTVLIMIARKRAQQAAVQSEPSESVPIPQQPVVPILQSPSPSQPIATTTPVITGQPQRRPVRSIDGFHGRRPDYSLQPKAAIPPRPLTVPSRSAPAKSPAINHRPLMNIDGILPL